MFKLFQERQVWKGVNTSKQIKKRGGFEKLRDVKKWERKLGNYNNKESKK